MKTLIQNRVITIPKTTGTQIYKSQFDSDKNYKNLVGIAAVAVSGDFSQDIEIEFKDDNGQLFSFAPAEVWVKDGTAISKDLTNIFRKVNVTSNGRNIYCNVKATNTATPVKFVVYYLQSNDGPEVRPFDFVTYDFNFASLPSYKNIVLPTKYKKVVGIAAVTANASSSKVMLHLENSISKQLDDIQLSALKITGSIPYDIDFFPVEFAADGQELKLYGTAADAVSGAVSGKVVFLLAD